MDTEDLISRVEEWSSQLQEEIDLDKATIDAVNILMVVAAFIAGVQAQVITLTIALPSSVLQRTANLSAFLGLVFEISGTFLGAVHSIALQGRSKTKSARLQRVALFKADLKTILKWYTKKILDEHQRDREGGGEGDGEGGVGEGGAEEGAVERGREGGREGGSKPVPAAPLSLFNNTEVINITGAHFILNAAMPQPISDTASDSEDRKERVQRVQSFFEEIRRNPLASSQGYIIDAVMHILHALTLVQSPPPPERNASHRTNTRLILNTVPLAVRPMFTFGNGPLITMAIGVAFLMISTILLAAGSQMIASEVWITSAGALLVVISLSLLPYSTWILKQISNWRNPRHLPELL